MSEANPKSGDFVAAIAAEETENSVDVTRFRRSPRSTASPEKIIPDTVREQFRNEGSAYYFPDGALAFKDRGNALTTRSENREVIRSLATIAVARGWEAVTVRGTERFRREAWAAATVQGLEVAGYTPTSTEREELSERFRREAVQRSAVDRDAAPANNRERGGVGTPERPPIVGQLVNHGAAPYQQRGDGPMSYFVTVETERGPRTVWGVDLGRAIKESETQAQVGDRVELRSVRKDLVTVKSNERDLASGEAEESKTTFRNRWVVEKEGFFERRAEAAKFLRDDALTPQGAVDRHPELAGSYVYLKVAEELAAKQLDSARDRSRFVAGVRAALADSVERGEPWARARIRDRTQQAGRVPDRGEDRVR
jgi:putative DNA primase/helicase